MNGPEHYAEAERLLGEAVSWDPDERQTRTDEVVLAAAQAHATLALAAATADAAVQRYIGDENTTDREWTQAIT